MLIMWFVSSEFKQNRKVTQTRWKSHESGDETHRKSPVESTRERSVSARCSTRSSLAHFELVITLTTVPMLSSKVEIQVRYLRLSCVEKVNSTSVSHFHKSTTNRATSRNDRIVSPSNSCLVPKQTVQRQEEVDRVQGADRAREGELYNK